MTDDYEFTKTPYAPSILQHIRSNFPIHKNHIMRMDWSDPTSPYANMDIALFICDGETEDGDPTAILGMVTMGISSVINTSAHCHQCHDFKVFCAERFEALMFLPLTWDIRKDDLPARILWNVGWVVLHARESLGWGHFNICTNLQPYRVGVVDYCGEALFEPMMAPKEFQFLSVDDTTIAFYGVYPFYLQEYRMLKLLDDKAKYVMHDKLQEYGITEIFNPRRQFIV